MNLYWVSFHPAPFWLQRFPWAFPGPMSPRNGVPGLRPALCWVPAAGHPRFLLGGRLSDTVEEMMETWLVPLLSHCHTGKITADSQCLGSTMCRLRNRSGLWGLPLSAGTAWSGNGSLCPPPLGLQLHRGGLLVFTPVVLMSGTQWALHKSCLRKPLSQKTIHVLPKVPCL